MKKIIILAVICLLASASPVRAQLTIFPSGRAEIGVNPFDPNSINPNYLQWLDTVTVLKIFGNYGDQAAGGHMTFGDTYLYNTPNVLLGELGYNDCDQMWLHGKNGTYVTAGTMATDTVMYYDPLRSTAVQFNHDVHTSGVFVQSDERFKEDIEPIENVLSSLEGLRAVSYILKNENAAKCLSDLSSMPQLTEKDSRDKAFFEQYYGELAKGSERYGFLAQNVQEIFPELVHTDKSGYMYVDYIGLIPILVQSINELQARLDAVEGNKQEAPALAAPVATQSEIEASLSSAKLYQNAPNPWSSETVIRYNLPQNVVSATIYVYDMQGLQLKSIPATGRGESQVTLTARDLKAGMYLYALVADGQLIDSKQMILTK